MNCQNPDYKQWDNIQTFTLIDAAYLWIECEPVAHSKDSSEILSTL